MSTDEVVYLVTNAGNNSDSSGDIQGIFTDKDSAILHRDAFNQSDRLYNKEDPLSVIELKLNVPLVNLQGVFIGNNQKPIYG